VEDRRIRLADGRVVSFADYGPAADMAVLWCHGGPGSRLEPAHLAAQAAQAGLRIIGIDRPGYGLSAPQPGRKRIVDVIHARHTAGLIPGADLGIVDDLGHFSIVAKVVPAIRALLGASDAARNQDGSRPRPGATFPDRRSFAKKSRRLTAMPSAHVRVRAPAAGPRPAP
jgi:alpha-beta hydrolase superfamily lysophospholipase